MPTFCQRLNSTGTANEAAAMKRVKEEGNEPKR
jgi:hypothetical protein